MIRELYELLTGTPWTTGRSAATDFGPPPGELHRDYLARFTDAQLVNEHDTIRVRLTQRVPA